MIKCLLLILAVSSINSLYIPLSSNEQRCMATFSFGHAESIKLELKFPHIEKQEDYGEYYEVSLKNSQTNQVQSQNIKSGTFKRQIHVTKQIIYHICFKFVSNRVINGLRVQYSAVTQFYYAPEQMNIPENLLKHKDLRVTYQAARESQKVAKRFQEIQQFRAQNQQIIFAETKKVGNRLIKLSILELLGILVLAGMQLYVIRGFFTKKFVV